jgi:4-aminobutyrate aminotransferase
MLILTTSVFDVIRFIPPLNVSEDEVDEACRIFKEALEEVAREG